MRLTRVYVDGRLKEGGLVVLGEAASSHLLRVLRLRPGAALTVFNGEGGEFAAIIEDLERGRVRLRIESFRPGIAESRLAITLAQGISRGERMDFTLQKSTELGVATIAPLVTAFCQVRLEGERLERRQDHWRGVLVGACEQCGRNRLPDLLPMRTLSEWLAEEKQGDGVLRLILDPEGNHRLSDFEPAQQVTLLVGPEGGLEHKEIDAARAAGFTPVKLGPRILRTESAGVAALAAMQALWGDLG